MGRKFKAYLSSDKKVWSCSSCSAHLAYQDDIMSRNFQGKHGRAYLINNVINVVLGHTEQRRLMTGLHTVADIHCNLCNCILGWKYVHAHDESQKYKEDKFLLEKEKIKVDRDHHHDGANTSNDEDDSLS